MREAWQDFELSRRALQCTPATLEFYRTTAYRFLSWVEKAGANTPADLKSKHVRAYLAELVAAGAADTTCHDHARAVKTLLRFFHREGYTPDLIQFEMPRLAKKRLPVLTPEQLEQVIDACPSKRDRAIVIFLADTGLRRVEVLALNWSDIDFKTGLVRVRKGKGNKARSAVCSPTTRRALLAYRRTLKSRPLDNDPLFLSRLGGRLSKDGINQFFYHLAKRTGIHVTAHALRRTFVILSLRAGMDVLHLQALLGHASLVMVQHYAQMVDDDLLLSHRAHSPIENLARLRNSGENEN